MRPAPFSRLEPRRFEDVAAHLARRFAADLFLSGGDFPGENTCVIAIRPIRELHVTARTTPGELADFAFSTPGPALGYLSYTYGLGLQGVRSTKRSDFPLGHLKKYAVCLIYDRAAQTLEWRVAEPATARSVREAMRAAPPLGDTSAPPGLTGRNIAQSLSREQYIAAVERVLGYIRRGYTYQLNMSLRFAVERAALDPLQLFLHLWSAYPAPFYVWFHSGPFRIISTSPERFLRVQDGEVLAQPIKGTLAFTHLDDSVRRRLTESPKEDAELSMIVDLVRNDISYHCEYGTVRVEDHKSVFAVEHLLQMYSNVRGRLREESTCLDLLLAAFPGGSVTGCPKKSSMAIIETLEPHSRDLYCGGFLLVWDRKNLDASIAIRTATYDTRAERLRFYAGSGIVADSVPEREYQETLAKAEKFVRLVPSGNHACEDLRRGP